jgi:hypothetical protein
MSYGENGFSPLLLTKKTAVATRGTKTERRVPATGNCGTGSMFSGTIRVVVLVTVEVEVIVLVTVVVDIVVVGIIVCTKVDSITVVPTVDTEVEISVRVVSEVWKDVVVTVEVTTSEGLAEVRYK